MHALSLEITGLSRSFGALRALDDVSLSVRPGTVHALLGGNGAGKTTLVNCVMGLLKADAGAMLLDGAPFNPSGPRDAQARGIGMVHQHFTLAPALTGAENLVAARSGGPAVLNWRAETAALEKFMARMPFRAQLARPAGALATGERQKLEILKLLYLGQRLLILDEPTSALTPDEADDILGHLRAMARRGEISVLMITHKLREAAAYCDDVTILRRGARIGGGRAGDFSAQALAAMMTGDFPARPAAARAPPLERPVLEISGLHVEGDGGRDSVGGLDLTVNAGEILGIAGVAGNGQGALIAALCGQRCPGAGEMRVHGELFVPGRAAFKRLKIFILPGDAPKNAAAADMSVAENLALRSFDTPPLSRLRWALSLKALRARAQELIAGWKIQTPSPQTPLRHLSGGTAQRVALARELSEDADLLILAGPCAGLDIAAAAEARAAILAQRGRGAAVLLVSEDLDEILELCDRVAVMSEGKIIHLTTAAAADRAALGRAMAGR